MPRVAKSCTPAETPLVPTQIPKDSPKPTDTSVLEQRTTRSTVLAYRSKHSETLALEKYSERVKNAVVRCEIDAPVSQSKASEVPRSCYLIARGVHLLARRAIECIEPGMGTASRNPK